MRPRHGRAHRGFSGEFEAVCSALAHAPRELLRQRVPWPIIICGYDYTPCLHDT